MSKATSHDTALHSAQAREPKARGTVLVQSGARDAYQVALALDEAGLLEALVTDLFWPADRAWAKQIEASLPDGLRTLLRQRSEPKLRSSRVTVCAATGLLTMLLDRWKGAPLSWRRRMTRRADRVLGQTAGRLARSSNSSLLSYSYYGYDAFRAYGRAGMLFQLHPHPASMRRLLLEELRAHPDCAASLEQEWELALPESDFNHLCRETEMARSFLAASSFTRATLIEHGAAPDQIRVVPYGVDASRFQPDPNRERRTSGRLRLLFVGRINQRKGIKYLLEALRLLRTDAVELLVCGRVVDDLALFRPFGDQVRIRPNVSARELISSYQQADLFVFPSIAEGFGQVLLESLACGLPVLATTHTAAPDLIRSGEAGFVVEPRSPLQLAQQIEWALDHRAQLEEMRSAARRSAESFTWERFRRGVVEAVLAEQQGQAGTGAPLSATEVAHAV